MGLGIIDYRLSFVTWCEWRGSVCVITFYTRKRVPSTPHDYESSPVEPLRHVGIVSTTEARSLNVLKRALRMDSGRGGSAGREWTKADSILEQGRAGTQFRECGVRGLVS